MPISLDVPALTVDTSSGYSPGIDDIAAFITSPAVINPPTYGE